MDIASRSLPAEPARRGRPRQAAEPRRQRIIAIAADLFLTQGYTATTLEAVSKAAGITKRSIYEMIGDKEALFRAVCHHCFEGLGKVSLDVRIRGDDLRQSLVDVATWLVQHTFSDETVNTVRAVLIERIRNPELVNRVISSSRRELHAVIAAFFEELAARGLLHLDDPMDTADIFYDVTVGNIGFRKAMGHDEALPDEAAIGRRVDIFIRGHLTRTA